MLYDVFEKGKGSVVCETSGKDEALYENVPFGRAAMWPFCVIERVTSQKIDTEMTKNRRNPQLAAGGIHFQKD